MWETQKLKISQNTDALGNRFLTLVWDRACVASARDRGRFLNQREQIANFNHLFFRNTRGKSNRQKRKSKRVFALENAKRFEQRRK